VQPEAPTRRTRQSSPKAILAIDRNPFLERHAVAASQDQGSAGESFPPAAGTASSWPGEASTGAGEEEFSAGTATGLSLSARAELSAGTATGLSLSGRAECSAGTATGLSLSARAELSAGTATGLSLEETAGAADAASLEAAGAGGGETCSPRGTPPEPDGAEPDGAGRFNDEETPAGPGSGAALSGGPAYDPGMSAKPPGPPGDGKSSHSSQKVAQPTAPVASTAASTAPRSLLMSSPLPFPVYRNQFSGRLCDPAVHGAIAISSTKAGPCPLHFDRAENVV